MKYGLNEALEAKRREILSLRATIARIDNGTYVTPREKELQSQVKELKAENKDLRRQLKLKDIRAGKADESYEHLRKSALKDQTENIELRKKISALEAEIAEKDRKIAELESSGRSKDGIIKKLTTSNEELLKQKNRDYTNSSKPSSQCSNTQNRKVYNSRKKSDRKPGAQEGHAGHHRPSALPYDDSSTHNLTCDEFINHPERYRDTGRQKVRQVISMRFVPVVETYISKVYEDLTTGKKVFAPFPKDCPNEYNYGPSVKALALMLTQYCNVSISKTKELICCLSGGAIDLAEGMINSLPQKFSALTESERKALWNALLSAPVVHNDATNMKFNGNPCNVFVTSDGKNVLYTYSKKKGFEGLDKCPLSDTQVIIHDHDRTYYNYGKAHQECLVHILRYLLEAIQLDPRFEWATLMSELLHDMIHKRKHKPGRVFSEAEITAFRKEYNNVLDTARKEYEDKTLSGSKEGKKLFARLEEYKDHILYFLDHPEVDCDNNLSERLLRKLKRKQKQVISLRSEESVMYLCDMYSIIESSKARGVSVYDKLLQVFSSDSCSA